MGYYVVPKEWEAPHAWVTEEHCSGAVARSEIEGPLSRADAIARVRRAGKTRRVWFCATSDEWDAWAARQRDRFRASIYVAVPWADDAYEQNSDLHNLHSPHFNVRDLTKVAFTASREDGVADRVLTMRPGRYLETYWPEFPSHRRAYYVAQCAALSATTFHLATVPAAIAAIYNTPSGPDSCMRRKPIGEYEWQSRMDNDDLPHPCEAYGAPGDLALAYLGDVKHGISQRAVVWPANKQYVRVYGTGPLEALLQAAGYSDVPRFKGARLRAVNVSACLGADDSWYLAPYVDPRETVGYLSRDRQFIYLHTDVDRTRMEIDLATTDGATTFGDQPTCADCGREIARGETYCEECVPWTCERCDDSLPASNQAHPVNGELWCGACYEEASRFCANADCDATWVEEELPNSGRRVRQRDGVNHFCIDCAPHMRLCCETWRDVRVTAVCEVCRGALSAAPAETVALEAPSADAAVIDDSVPGETWYRERPPARSNDAFWCLLADGSQWYFVHERFQVCYWEGALGGGVFERCAPPTVNRPTPDDYTRASRPVPALWEVQNHPAEGYTRIASIHAYPESQRRGAWIVCGHDTSKYAASFEECQALATRLRAAYPHYWYRVVACAPVAPSVTPLVEESPNAYV